MSDLVTCPKCRLSQSARHAFCARCDHSFDGPTTQDDTPSSPGGTPTDRPEDTPTDHPPPPQQPRKPALEQTAESPPSDTVEEALPDAPSWDLPNRPASSNPGRVRVETSRSRAPGLDRNRGSLAQRMNSGSIDKVSDLRPPTPTGAPASDPGVRGAGRAGELRGRPPSSLYPSENSAPPGDPLMAALVSGDDLRMTPPPPPPDILADELEVRNPPIHRTDPAAHDPLYPNGPPTDEDFSGPRVVPPSTKRRVSTGAGSHKAVRRDPRGRPVASAPSSRGGILPDSASSPGRPVSSASIPPVPAPPSRSGSRPPIGRTGGLEQPSRSGWPAGDPGGSGSASARTIPLPPPPTSLGSSRRAPVDLKGLLIRGLLIALAVLVVWAAWDVWQLFGSLGTLNAEVTAGNMATPALVGELDEQVKVLGLEDAVVQRWARIAGETDTYAIGVEVRHRVIVFPVHYTVQRDGPFRVDQKLTTLEYFVENGWELDGTAETKLRIYLDHRSGQGWSPPPPPEVEEPAPDGSEPAEAPAESGG